MITEPHSPLKVVWVIVNYFNDADTLHFVQEEFLKLHYPSVELFIVNNGSDNPASLHACCEKNTQLHFLEPASNLGYLGALYFVLDELKRKEQSFDYILLTNTDIELAGADFLTRIVGLAQQSKAMWLGPEIISSESGKNQNPYYRHRISESKLHRLQLVFSNYFLYLFYRLLAILKSRLPSKKDSEKDASCYALHGSFFMIRNELAEAMMQYEEQCPFLYEEELFLAEICNRMHFKVEVLKEVSVKHTEHAVTGSFKSRRHVYYLYQSIQKVRSTFFN
jgi:hypothetical protein